MYSMVTICRTFLLAFLFYRLGESGATTETPFPQRDCIFEGYPSPDGNPNPSFDGGFENALPLARDFLRPGAATIRGCVCRRGFSGELQPPLLGGQISLLDGLTDATCNATCVEAEERFGYLPGSDSFLVSKDNAASGVEAGINIVGDTMTPEFPNLRFNMAFEDVSGLNADHDITVGQFFLQVFDEANSKGEFVNLFRYVFAFDDNVTDTDCGSSKWVRFTIPLASVLTSQEFALVNFSLRTSQIAIGLKSSDQLIAIDNVEFVGPALTNQTLLDLLALPELQTELKNSELSILGEDALDAFFTILAIASLISAVAVSVVSFKSKSHGLATYVVRRFAAAWLFVSTVLTIYAVVEYFQFVEDAADFDVAAQARAAEVQQILQLDGFDPRQLRRITEGKAVYGAFALPLPRLERSQLEELFESEGGTQLDCQETRLSPGNCVSTLDDYLEFLNTTARLDEGNLDRRNWAATTVEGTVTPSQEHFLPLLLASLVFDIVVTALLVFGILLARRSKEGFQKASHRLRFGEAVFTVLNFALVVATFVVAFAEPIRYSVSMNLIDFRYKTGVNVKPKPDRFVTDSLGGLRLDSSAIGIVEECFDGDEATRFTLMFTYFEGLFFAISEELSPATVGTSAEACSWSESAPFAKGNTTLCYSIDCSQGSLALVQPEAVDPLYRFVISEVVFGIILVDLLVSFVDVLVLLQVYALERQVSLEPGKEVKPEAIVVSKSDV